MNFAGKSTAETLIQTRLKEQCAWQLTNIGAEENSDENDTYWKVMYI